MDLAVDVFRHVKFPLPGSSSVHLKTVNKLPSINKDSVLSGDGLSSSSFFPPALLSISKVPESSSDTSLLSLVLITLSKHLLS